MKKQTVKVDWTCKNAFIFDLDGTLIDAYPAIVASLNHTLEKLGRRPAPAGDIIRAVGLGNDSLLETFVPTGAIARARQIYRRHHVACLPAAARPLPGALALLETLKRGGARLAVATNRPAETAEIMTAACGMKAFFNVMLSGEDVPRPKPAPDILVEILGRLGLPPEAAVYFGDMDIDAQTGRAAGVETVIVTTGSSTRAEIEAERPGLVLDSLEALLPAARRRAESAAGRATAA
jgi:phosphoglycolate phosphatase